MLSYQNVAKSAFSLSGMSRLISNTEICQIYLLQWFINTLTCFLPREDLFSLTLTGLICGSAVIKNPGTSLHPLPRLPAGGFGERGDNRGEKIYQTRCPLSLVLANLLT